MSPTRIKESWRTLLICVLLSAVTLAVFWPVSHYGIIYYDDPQYVTENLHVLEGLTWENVKWATTAVCAGNWHPLTLLSHMADVQLFGLKLGWHHLVNLVLHTANSLLLFLLLKRLTGATWRSAFVAALFALHPLHVESVAWIAERKDVLSTFFFMLTLGAYARYTDARVECRVSSVESQVSSLKSQVSGPKPSDYALVRRSPGEVGSRITQQVSRFTFHVLRFTHHASLFYLLALAVFLFGLMSKPMLVTLPFVLLLLDYWPLGRWKFGARGDVSRSVRWSLVWEKVPFFVLSAASCIITFLVQRSSGAVSSLEQVAFERRLGNAVISYFAYLKQAFWPADLAVIYPYPALLPDAEVTAGALLLCGICVAAVLLLRRWPYVAVGWFWFVGMLVPVIGLVQVGEQARADRYTYLPLTGIFIIVAWGVPALVTQIGNLRYGTGPAPGFCSAALVAAGIAILTALAWTAHRQVRYWRSTYALFEHATRVTDANYAAFQGVGIALLHEGDYGGAVTNLTYALELSSSRGAGGGVKYYLGAALQLQGKPLEALPYLEQAVVGPELVPAKNLHLGLSLLVAGRVAEAEVALNQALAAKPRDPEVQLANAILLHSQSRDADSEKLFQDIIAAHPKMAQAHRSYADFLNLLGRPAEAEAQYAMAVKLESPDVGLLRAYAAVLAKRGKPDDAIRRLEQASKQDPGNPQVDFELAELLSDQGRKREAIAWYDRAIEINPKLISALNNLAWMLATDPDDKIRNGSRAVELAERACEAAEWKPAVLMGTLAAAYAEAVRFPDAVQMAERARDKAQVDKQEAVAKRNEELLELYRSGKPYREAPGAK